MLFISLDSLIVHNNIKKSGVPPENFQQNNLLVVIILELKQ